MTTTPSISIFPSERRMAPPAAPSAVFLSPRPIQRALARAPASVTRTSSRARLRLISADTLSVARSGRAISAWSRSSVDLSQSICGCYACDVPAWRPRTYFSWAGHRRENFGNHRSAARDGSRLDPARIDPWGARRAANLPDLSANGCLLTPHRHRPVPGQDPQGRRGLRLQPQQRPRCGRDAAGAPTPFPLQGLCRRSRRLDLQAQMGRGPDATVDQHLSDSEGGWRPTGARSIEGTSRPSLVGCDLYRGDVLSHGQHRH